MALVQYSDSECSDDDQVLQTVAADTRVAPKTTTISETKTEKFSSMFSSIVDRGNPRKIRIALPDIKAENQPGQSEYDQDGPARKKPRTGGGGLFSGFNSILPAPKRTNLPTTNLTSGNASGNRKVFSLRTGAGPGFDREADAAWREDQTLNSTPPASSDSSAVPKSGGAHNDGKEGSLLKEENYKKKGNAMIFKPLSVARNTSKKKSAAFVAARATPAVTPNASGSKRPEEPTNKHEASSSATAESSDVTSTQKPRVSLFSFSSDEKVTPAPSSHEYESIVYAPHESDVSSDVAEDLSTLHEHNVPHTSYPSPSTQQQSTLDAIASDLNLSRAQRRQLMGRNSAAAQNNSRILTFNTDAEYASNQEMLSKTTEEELAAAQHNPVRAIAPGKHSLRQLVQAANSQKDALEDSFAAGRRNKKEAGARYGW